MVTSEEQSKRNKRLAWLLVGIFVVMLIGSTVLLMLSALNR
jgi:flagellar basal body-associated protein FliL